MYNASRLKPVNTKLNARGYHAQVEMGEWLRERLEMRNREFREVAYGPPPRRDAINEVAGGTELAEEHQVERVLGHEFNDYTGRLVFHLEWRKVDTNVIEVSWERNASVLGLEVVHEYLLRHNLVSYDDLLDLSHQTEGAEEMIQRASLRVHPPPVPVPPVPPP